MDELIKSFIGAIALSLLAMMLTRVATIAAARRVSYAAVASKLVELWRLGSPQKHAIYVELTKLVIDGNPDLYPPIERLVDHINGGQPIARDDLLDLLDTMRGTASLALVRESFVSSGPSRKALLAKLLIE